MQDVGIILTWWIVVQLLGLAAWPLARYLLRRLPDQGYTAAKPLGLLLVAFALWLLGSLHLVQNNLGGIWLALALVVAASVWALSYDGLASLHHWLSQNVKVVLVYELLFAVALCGWAAFRATTPAISSTEKPMEFAFLNAILRSPSFPPHDPWLSGSSINYYYFGYVMMAMMTRLTGTIPSIAYNVSSALWFALIAGGAFGAGYNIAQISSIKSQISNAKSQIPNTRLLRPILVGLLATMFVILLGNLEGTLELAHQNGIGSAGFWKWLDIQDLSGPPTSGGGLVPQRYLWWWRASRVVHDYTLQGGNQEVIDEFPFFSFLNGDLHPHTLAYPFTFLAILLALNVYQGKQQEAGNTMQDAGGKRQESHLTSCILHRSAFLWPDLLLYAICLGALGFLNTWDLPIYVSLVLAAFGLRRWLQAGRLDKGVIVDTLKLGAILGVGSLVLYLPFYANFQPEAHGVLPNLFNGTRLAQFLVMFGVFAVPATLFVLALAARQARKSMGRFWLTASGWAVVLLLVASLSTLLLGIVSPKGHTILQAWQSGQPVPGADPDIGTLAATRLLERLLDPWTAVSLALALVVIWKLVGSLASKSTGCDQNQSSHSQSHSERPKGAKNLCSRKAETLRLPQLRWGAHAVPAALRRRRARRGDNSDQPVLVTSANDSVPFVLLLLFLGAGLALSVEFFYLADSFGTRMNTVFKFYYQVWALWGVAAAYATSWLVSDSNLRAPFRVTSGAIAMLLVVGGLTYPVMAISTVGDRAHPTLDGAAWVAQSAPDEYAAIQWLNKNVAGSPVILEAPGQSYHPDESRVATFTGLPTVLGWAGHEVQWRGADPQISQREQDINTIYTTLDSQQALSLLNKYDVTFVYVGPTEHALYPAAGLNKFGEFMDVAFHQGDVTLYRRR
jgi:YYY domain-containing protein